MEVNKKYYIKLTTITPLSVGAGNEEEWVKCADYVIKDGKVYVLDLHKVAELGIDLSQLSLLFVKNDHDGVVNLLGNKIEAVSARIFNLPCTSDNNIKAFERSQLHNLPLVAGSSLKGAIRTALFNHFRDFEEDNESVFGSMRNGSDFMRFIQVGDIEMNETQLFNSKIFNLRKDEDTWEGGWKHAKNSTNEKFQSVGFNTLYECVAPTESGYGTIILCSQHYQNVLKQIPSMAHADRKSELMNGGIKILFAIINSYTKRYLKKELAFFNKYPADQSDKIIDNINNLLGMIPSDNSSCLIKMSAGVGFHAITGDWQFEDYSATGIHKSGPNEGKKKYKSRKTVETAIGLSLMGFVMLSEATESDYRSRIAEIETDFTNRMQLIAEQKAAAAAQAEAAENEKNLKEQKYSQLLKESEEAERNGNFLTAIEKAEEANNLFFSKELTDCISRLKPKAEQQRLEKEAKEAEARIKGIEEKPLAEDINITNADTFQKFLGRCKKRKAELQTPEGEQLIHKWMEDFFAKLMSNREKKPYLKVAKWNDVPVDKEKLKAWIAEFNK